MFLGDTGWRYLRYLAGVSTRSAGYRLGSPKNEETRHEHHPRSQKRRISTFDHSQCPAPRCLGWSSHVPESDLSQLVEPYQISLCRPLYVFPSWLECAWYRERPCRRLDGEVRGTLCLRQNHPSGQAEFHVTLQSHR